MNYVCHQLKLGLLLVPCIRIHLCTALALSQRYVYLYYVCSYCTEITNMHSHIQLVYIYTHSAVTARI